MELICIKCPRGCNLTIENGVVTGNLCPRGKDYAMEEMTCPMRIVTALGKGENGEIFPVKTSIEIPKSKIDDVLKEIGKLRVSECKIGDVIIKNVCDTGADIVVTGEKYVAE